VTTETADNLKLKQDNAAIQVTLVITTRLVEEKDELIRVDSKLEHTTNRLRTAMDQLVQLQSDLSNDTKAEKYFRSQAEVAFAVLEGELESAEEGIRSLIGQFETRITFL
jgi:small-conductance mechanosensitive channel